MKIFDSTTSSLFKDILEGVGRNPKTGKKKGGIKVHNVVNADEIVQEMVWFSEAKKHDHQFNEISVKPRKRLGDRVSKIRPTHTVLMD